MLHLALTLLSHTCLSQNSHAHHPHSSLSLISHIHPSYLSLKLIPHTHQPHSSLTIVFHTQLSNLSLTLISHSYLHSFLTLRLLDSPLIFTSYTHTFCSSHSMFFDPFTHARVTPHTRPSHPSSTYSFFLDPLFSSSTHRP